MDVLPQGWIRAPLENLCQFNPRDIGNISDNDLVSFVPMPAVSDTEGKIMPHGTRPFSEVSKGYTRFQNGDVIFAKITPCMENGKIAIAENLFNGAACGSTEFHVLRPTPAIQKEYLWRYLRQGSFRKLAESEMTGAVGQRRVPVDFLKRHEIALPPENEQKRIVQKLDSLFARILTAKEELSKVAVLSGNRADFSLIDQLAKAILEKAFRGELIPQDPNDEPASALLERIAAEKPTVARKNRSSTPTSKNLKKSKQKAA